MISLNLSLLSFITLYQSLGRKRTYHITGFLSALILQKIFPIPTVSLLILFLSLCKELKDFCGFLKDDFHFSKTLIPYNPRNESILEKVGYNAYGYPTCPKDGSLTMKYAGQCHEKGRSDRNKRVCPKVHMVKGKWVCDCHVPCSTAKKGHTTYTYDNMDFRIFPGVQRDSDKWKSLYKTRTIVECASSHFKICALPDAEPVTTQLQKRICF